MALNIFSLHPIFPGRDKRKTPRNTAPGITTDEQICFAFLKAKPKRSHHSLNSLTSSRAKHAPSSGTGVGLVIRLFNLVAVEMGIYLGGGNINVAKELLNRTEIGTALQQMGGKGMP